MGDIILIVQDNNNESETMGYQEGCEDFAVNGCTMREHYDHEANSDYDRWDGHRGDFNDEFAWELDEEDHNDWLDCENRKAHVATMTDRNYVDCRDLAELEN